MTDITLGDVSSGYNLSVINANFQILEQVVNNELLHRTGSNSQMQQSLDMNNFSVLNVKGTISEEDAQAILDECEAARDIALASSQLAQLSEEVTQDLYDMFRDDYAGSGTQFPNENDGTLFYYYGPEHSQGLYITFASNNEPGTGNWRLVSGVGPAGPTGPQGVQGPIGPQGIQGAQGIEGIQGQDGIQGPIGATGPRGNDGPTGPTGPQGEQGNTGATGQQGLQGIQGLQGPQGVQGNTGAKGDQGESFDIDETGLLSELSLYDNEVKGFVFYATDYSVVPDAEAKYDRFTGDGVTTDFALSYLPDGPQSLEVTIGGVVQIPDNYTVVITTSPDLYTVQLNVAPGSGTSIGIREYSVSTGYGAVFVKQSSATADWTDAIPFGKGPRGDQGPTGIAGPQGPQGDVGATGAQGPIGPEGIQGPQGEIGPQGLQGDQGDVGERGPDGIQGPEGPIGPQGVQGLQGPDGIAGPQGPQGDVGEQGLQGNVGPTGPTGPTGSQGIRGSRGYYLPNKTSWSAVDAVNQIGEVIENDLSTQYSEPAGFSETRVFTGGAAGTASNWDVVDKTVDNTLVISAGVESIVPTTEFRFFNVGTGDLSVVGPSQSVNTGITNIGTRDYDRAITISGIEVSAQASSVTTEAPFTGTLEVWANDGGGYDKLDGFAVAAQMYRVQAGVAPSFIFPATYTFLMPTGYYSYYLRWASGAHNPSDCILALQGVDLGAGNTRYYSETQVRVV